MNPEDSLYHSLHDVYVQLTLHYNIQVRVSNIIVFKSYIYIYIYIYIEREREREKERKRCPEYGNVKGRCSIFLTKIYNFQFVSYTTP